ncbi:hypothetical protein JMJ77_0007514, partial [Colletotrichum scovillei]
DPLTASQASALLTGGGQTDYFDIYFEILIRYNYQDVLCTP